MYLMMGLPSLFCSERDGNEFLETNDRLALYPKSKLTVLYKEFILINHGAIIGIGNI